MSYTNVRSRTTSNRRGRGRGPGNQQNGYNRSNNVNDFTQQSNRTNGSEHSRSDNRNNESNWKQSNYKGNNQHRGNAHFRGRGNNNNDGFGRGAVERSRSSSSTGSSSNLHHGSGTHSGRWHSNQSTECDWKQSDYKGNNQHSRGQGNFKGRGNFNNSERGTYERSHSSSSTGSSLKLLDMQGTASRVSRHAQNPIFVGELMERFNSILPTSNLLVPEEPSSVQQRIVPLQNNSENLTFASISNNITQGFRNSRRKSRERSPAHGSHGINEERRNFRSSSHGRFKGSNQSSRGIGPDPLYDNDKQKPKLSEKACQRPQDIPNKQNPKFSNAENNHNTIEGVSSLREEFFSQLDAIDACKSKHGSKHKQKNVSSFELKPNNDPQDYGTKNATTSSTAHTSDNLGNNNLISFDLPRQIFDYTHFLDSQKPSNSQNHNKPQQKPASPVQHLSRGDCEVLSTNINKSNTMIGNELPFIHGDVAGGTTPFNIQQRLANPNQRVPTREEVLARKEQEYQVQAKEHEEKKRAKRLEKLLARYPHVEVGHRLTDGYLNEAAEYDRELVPFLLSEEEARRIQQERLVRDALAFREREREEDEKRAAREAANKEKWLKKHAYVDSGYKLGHRQNKDEAGGSQGLEADPPRRSPSSVATTIHGDRLVSQQPITLPNVPITGQEFLLQGESPEEFLERQQEQLLLKERQSQAPAQLMQKEELLPKKTNQIVNNPQNPGAAGDGFRITSPPPVLVVKPIQTSPPVVQSKVEDAEVKKQKLLSQLEMLMTKTVKSQTASSVACKSVIQDPTDSKIPPDVAQSSKPAVCVVKNPSQGTVLVLRPTEEALNKTLVNYLEVVDEMDKLGQSSLYQPQTELAPLYSNNRFDWKQSNDTPKAVGEWKPSADYARALATGGIPEEMSPPPSPKLPEPELKPSTPPKEQAEPVIEDPTIDFQAEMRAARLKMQQKYEESLRKQKEQEN